MWAKKKRKKEPLASDRKPIGSLWRGKGGHPFPLPGPPLGSLRSPTVFLSDPVFWLFSPLRQPGLRLPQLETIPDSRPNWAKSIPVFWSKRRKNPTLWRRGWGRTPNRSIKILVYQKRQTSHSSWQFLKVKLGRVVQVQVCRLRKLWILISLIWQGCSSENWN